jgi:hypothetical protein
MRAQALRHSSWLGATSSSLCIAGAMAGSTQGRYHPCHSVTGVQWGRLSRTSVRSFYSTTRPPDSQADPSATQGIFHGAGIAASQRAKPATGVPNKGVRQKPAIPDRFKDAFNYFGADANRAAELEIGDGPYIPENKRHSMVKDVMSNTQYHMPYNKADRISLHLEGARRKPPGDNEWTTAQMQLRSVDFCLELLQHPSDAMPTGEKLWLDLNVCTERRIPYLMELEDGTLLLPIFSMETHIDYYFQKLNCWEACWFPHPRMGTQREVFNRLSFPVCGTGSIAKVGMMATVAIPHGRKVVCVLNPFSNHTKFLTFPELLNLNKAKNENGNVIQSSETLQKVFNTVNWKAKRVDPTKLPPVTEAERKLLVPLIATMELRLLMFDLLGVEGVYIQTKDVSKWKQWVGGAKPKNLLITIVLSPGAAEDVAAQNTIRDRLSTWSFLSEFGEGDFNVTTSMEPPPASTDSLQTLYTKKQGEIYRKSTYIHGPSLREKLGYDEPLGAQELDEQVYSQPEISTTPINTSVPQNLMR